jgi:hypothetical protein
LFALTRYVALSVRSLGANSRVRGEGGRRRPERAAEPSRHNLDTRSGARECRRVRRGMYGAGRNFLGTSRMPLPVGAHLRSGWWPALGRSACCEIGRRRSISTSFRYKRPAFLASGRSREWRAWKRSYFRFSVKGFQQRALDACARELGTNGFVAHGCPAFYRRRELFEHIERQTLVANTHFADAKAREQASTLHIHHASKRGKSQ